MNRLPPSVVICLLVSMPVMAAGHTTVALEMHNSTGTVAGSALRPSSSTVNAAAPVTPAAPETLHRLVRRARVPAISHRVKSGWISDCNDQNAALDALAALGPAAHAVIPDLVRLTHRTCIHDHVMNALDVIGSPDASQIAAIAGGMEDRDPEARQAALDYVMQEAKPTQASIRMLGRAMNDSDSGVRLSALQALEQIHPEGEGRLPILAGFMKDPSVEIRQRALYMVGKLGPDAHSAIPLLRQALNDPEPVIALVSAQILAQIDPWDDVLIATLTRYAKRKDGAVGPQAAELLESLNVHNASVDAALDTYRKQEALNGRLRDALSDTSPEELAENARSLKVNHLRVATSIVDNQPVHTGRAFPAKVGRLYCWTEVAISSPPATVIHRWYRNGKLEHEAYLEVNDPVSPLWSSHPVRAGDWKVTVTPAGAKDPLATAVFHVSGK